MEQYIKQRILKNLKDEIECLNSIDLEKVGHGMISIIEEKSLIHHGVNVENKHSGYTVDSFSQDGSIIGEYSTEKGYFDDYVEGDLDASYRKIRKDINHALEHVHVSKIKRIYLISNQHEPPSFRQRFNNTDVFLENRDILIIYDSSEIARIIYQQSIDNAYHAEFYKQYFPLFSHDMDNFEYYGKIPARCEQFYSEPDVLELLDKHFKSKRSICVLYGLSGSGKTQTAIDYVHSRSEKFENYIWITGDDWTKDTALSAVQRTRGGKPINVAGLFNKLKTILIIDNIERVVEEKEFHELKTGFELGGVVLLTSQLANPGREHYLAMPPFNEAVALHILGEDNKDSVLTKRIIAKCKSSPLILSTIRSMIEYEYIDRDDLYKEVLESPEDVTGGEGTSILNKILKRLDTKSYEDLKRIANTGMTVFDIEFLRKFITNLSCRKLQILSIIMPTNIKDVVKVHDLICVAMKDEIEDYRVVQKIEEYIDQKKGEMTPNVLRQIHLAKDVIRKYKAEHQNTDWLTYALMQIEGEEKYECAEALYSLTFDKNMSLSEVMCLIEAKELHGYVISGKKREDYYKYCIEQYENAVELYEDMDIKTELLHHLGKTLRRNKEYKKAYERFEDALKLKPRWYATYGQIVTLGTVRGDSELRETGNGYMKLLLTDMLKDTSQVPLRVSLAAIARLRSYRDIANEMINCEEKVKKIAQIVKNAALEDIGQFFEAFVAISSMFSFHYSEVCISIVESVPEMIMVTPDMMEKNQWVNICEALTNLAIAAQDREMHKLEKTMFQKSREFADELSLKEQISVYEARALAKTYIKMGEPSKALLIIEKIPVEKQDHWLLYRKAEGEMLLNSETAIITAKQAYELLKKDSKNMDRQSSYLELIGKCYEIVGDYKNAINVMETAVEECNDEKYKNQLKNYVERLRCVPFD